MASGIRHSCGVTAGHLHGDNLSDHISATQTADHRVKSVPAGDVTLTEVGSVAQAPPEHERGQETTALAMCVLTAMYVAAGRTSTHIPNAQTIEPG